MDDDLRGCAASRPELKLGPLQSRERPAGPMRSPEDTQLLDSAIYSLSERLRTSELGAHNVSWPKHQEGTLKICSSQFRDAHWKSSATLENATPRQRNSPVTYKPCPTCVASEVSHHPYWSSAITTCLLHLPAGAHSPPSAQHGCCIRLLSLVPANTSDCLFWYCCSTQRSSLFQAKVSRVFSSLATCFRRILIR